MQDYPEEKRMAGDYEVTQAIHIGGKEVVFGVNPDENASERYLCAFCRQNDIFGSYEECMVGDDYLELMKLFCSRVLNEAGALQAEYARMPADMKEPVLPEQCFPSDYSQCIEGKVVAVRLSSLRPEYHAAVYQLEFVKGGNGAQENPRGTKVYCKNLYDGHEGYYRRHDILGEVRPEHMPQWAKDSLSKVQAEKEKPKRRNSDAR